MTTDQRPERPFIEPLKFTGEEPEYIAWLRDLRDWSARNGIEMNPRLASWLARHEPE